LGSAEGAVAAGMSPMEVVAVASMEDAIDTVTRRVHGGDVLLVKASRASGLEELAEALRVVLVWT
jgi:UDP-N-acetylmuramoyl-tripeptide--D-alanyl-D-alanine ligase